MFSTTDWVQAPSTSMMLIRSNVGLFDLFLIHRIIMEALSFPKSCRVRNNDAGLRLQFFSNATMSCITTVKTSLLG